MVRYDGDIITCNGRNTVAKHLVTDGGRIVYVGDEIPEPYKNCTAVDLGDGALLPAFVDSHQHFASFATFHAGLNVMDAESNAEIVEWLREFASKSSAKLIIGFGASPHSVSDGHLITRGELDSACPDRPVMIVKYDGHACILNSALLGKLKNKISSLRGYHPDTGEMNQEAFFAVSDYISSSLSLPEMVGNMQRAMDYEASKGIGMVHSVSGVGFTGNLDITMEQWVGRSAKSGFQIRLFPQSMDVGVALRRGLPRIGGCFACALDGCYGSMDAAMKEPYLGTDSSGVLYYTDDEVADFCKKANRAGLQIEMHAIGDRAFDQATRALKAALDDCPRINHRHGIIHCCLPTEEGLKICADYHIQMPVQTAFIRWKQEPDEYLESILGERAQRLNPLRKMLDMGIVLSAGSDAPCTDPDPISWIYKACNHSVPEQSVSVYEALRMCTYNGAWTTFDEIDRGSLEEGKLADMTLLSKNPYSVPREKLNELRVERTWLGGEPYSPQTGSAVSAALRGMFSKNKI
jgi:predicted amidohydrolase YtcJ